MEIKWERDVRGEGEMKMFMMMVSLIICLTHAFQDARENQETSQKAKIVASAENAC